jgi:hypothetical protein
VYTDAWYVVTHTDPLLDSDEELADEHVRDDYRTPMKFLSLHITDEACLVRRLQIISRLRRMEPTLEPASTSAHGYDMLTQVAISE